MSRNGRKQITTMGLLLGVASDGGLISEMTLISDWKNEDSWKTTILKIVSYKEGVMEIAVDWKVSITRIVQLVIGMFAEKSNFSALDSIILNYNTMHVQIKKDTDKRDIIYMIRQEMYKPNYKDNISVDTKICRASQLLRDSDSIELGYEMYIDPIEFICVTGNKNLFFQDDYRGNGILISSIKEGIVTLERIIGCPIFEIFKELRKFFVPYCKFYGVKAVDFRINRFSIRVDETNIDRILYLYDMFCVIFDNSKEMENFN